MPCEPIVVIDDEVAFGIVDASPYDCGGDGFICPELEDTLLLEDMIVC